MHERDARHCGVPWRFMGAMFGGVVALDGTKRDIRRGEWSRVIPGWFQRIPTDHDASRCALLPILDFTSGYVGLRRDASASGAITNQLLSH